ncbi:MAG TPA: acyl carrier protein [Candidatus Competibacteraceae bacterium]|nr:acyl carrier protein [Candidatus Competibacteraceae bacterium]
MKENLEYLIKQVMSDILNLSPDSITDDTSVDNTESWDSANHIQLVIALEEEFSISFDPSEFEAMLSYLDVLQMVQSKL